MGREAAGQPMVSCLLQIESPSVNKCCRGLAAAARQLRRRAEAERRCFLCDSSRCLSFSLCDLLFPCDRRCSALFLSLAFFPLSFSFFSLLPLVPSLCVSPGACALTLLLCRIFHLQTVSGFPCWPLIVLLFGFI